MKNAQCYQPGYPRPQFVNPRWLLLNGSWAFAFDDADEGETKAWFLHFPTEKKIEVPFAYQCRASGVADKGAHDILWYERQIHFPAHQAGERVYLNFEGADYLCKVWVNGIYQGFHQGGYTRFSFDVTAALQGDNGEVVLRIEDRKSAYQPRGKQTWLKEPFGCWYTATSGLWKSVWCEVVPSLRLERARITPEFATYKTEFDFTFSAEDPSSELETEISFEGHLLSKTAVAITRKKLRLDVDMNDELDGFRIRYWTPENPQVYDVVFRLKKDGKIQEEIGSYFAFRSLHAIGNCLLLNNNPVYLRMVLDQGYYVDSGLTAPNEEALKNDILLAKNLGFNGVRMHQKIEDERFYYYADMLGIMVWCEMPSCYEYQDETVTNCLKEWSEALLQNVNHPSIVAWVPINESWGVPRIVLDEGNQSLAQALYYTSKALDPSRLVISNDGWEQVDSDLVTLHNYAQNGAELAHFYGDLPSMLKGDYKTGYSQTRLPFAKGYAYQGQPVLLSEFAGIGYQNDGQQGWGYGEKVASEEAYLSRFTGLVKAIRANDGFCGFCVTQLTDVESEINGLCDAKRTPKVKIEELRKAITQ